MNDYLIFEICKGAALGDLYRGRLSEESAACVEAIRIRDRSGNPTYILNGWGDKVAAYPTL